MALNYIWVGFFIIAFIVALFKLIFLGDTQVFSQLVEGMFGSSKTAVMEIALPLTGAMALWLGVMNIAEQAGAIRLLSRIVGPFFSRLFPGVPKDHPAVGQMLMNFSANLLGLDNAATPLGLKAMDSLQELNPKKDTASDAQVMFLVLHTSGLQLLPVTIIAQRAILNAQNPADIFIPCIIGTYVATLAGILVVAFKQRINLLDKVIIAWLGGMTAFITLVVWYFSQLPSDTIKNVSNIVSSVMLFAIPVVFITGGLIKNINVFGAFIDGAKAAFETSVKIIPYLVAMLVGISVFRACGAMDYINDGFRWVVTKVGADTRFVDAMPVAYLKPLSGSGSKAMMIDTMKTFGPDSFASRLACIFNGSADTTFYIVALYFGSVGIKKSRYAIPAGLVADLAGIITAIFVAYIFFG